MNNIEELQALYIHIPFCTSICTYCDFYKRITKVDLQEKYTDYLIKEIELKKHMMKDIKTVYIGGGTPSSIPLKSLNDLLSSLWKYLNKDLVFEFTIEANPNDINQKLIDILLLNHVNRVSLGVQSFNDEKLIFLGRNHNGDAAINAVKLLQANNINNISCDLIYATPEDTFDVVKKDIDKLISLDIPHISAYSLILEEKTVLYYLFKKKKFEMLDEDREFELYKLLNNYFHDHGYNQYEVSNYSKPNMESNHNLVYWNNKHYLGIGAGASYYIDNIRYTNIMNLESYYRGIDNKQLEFQEKTILSIHDQMQEQLLLGFRKVNGININEFYDKFNKNVFTVFPIIEKLMEQGLLEVNNDNLYIPKTKIYLSNSVLIHFI